MSVLNNKSNVFLLGFDDEGNDWDRAYKEGLSCEERMQLAKPPRLPIIGQISSSIQVLDAERPHYWFIAVMACGTDISVDYDVEFTQASEDQWVWQFSYDEQGLAQLYITFFVVYSVGAIVHAYTVQQLFSAASYHSIVKLLTATIGLGWLSTLFLFVHFAVYSHNGIGVPALRSIGELADMLGQVVFMFLLILIAKGWCISTTNLQGKTAILGALISATVTYIGMFIWETVGLDPASILYVYQTPPGIVIIAIRCLAMLLFVFSIRRTYTDENNEDKRKLYLVFGILYLVWFLSLPLVTSIAAVIDPWMRQKVVLSLYVTMNAVFVLGLGYVFWPTVASEYFKISSLDIMATPYGAI
jgi:hypothetical protein